jgi:uncharacterized repeat protein (TIGR01451 family)
MKSFLKISAFLIFFLISKLVAANHAAGGALKYIHLAGNQYQIYAVLLRDCSGEAAPANITVYITSTQCGLTDSLVLNPVIGTGQEVIPPCEGAFTTCAGGSTPGIQKWEYKSVYTFSGQCSDWLMFTTIATRSPIITTIQNPAGSNLYLEARLNNLIGDNNSPQNSVDFFQFVCIGQQIDINPGMIDPDGDSLVYELIPARTDANTNVNYIGSYSALEPVSSIPAPIFDPTTGDLVINATTVETGLVVYRVLEYRNSVLIGSRMFETILFTIPCTNTNPTLGWQGGWTFYVAPRPFCISFTSDDNNVNDTLRMSANTQNFPFSTFSTIGNYHPTGTFCWSPDSSDVRPYPYIIAITLRDNSCPYQGASIYTFQLMVTLDTNLINVAQTYAFYSGKLFCDLNANGIRDSLESGFPNHPVSMTPDNITSFSRPNGDYFFYTTGNGSQTITSTPPVNWYLSTDSLSYTLADDSLSHNNLDFGFAPGTAYNDLNIFLTSTPPTCNMVEYYSVRYENHGTISSDGRVIFVIDSATSLIQSSPLADSVSGDTLIYNFSNLLPFQSSSISLSLMMPAAGTALHFYASVEMDSAGSYYFMDDIVHNQVVGCSFDPNDKAVEPEGLFGDHLTLSTEFLEYTIRFQNTGNDTAFKVFIQDTIDPSLDLNTLRITGYSHAITTTIFPQRIVEFRFANILLPDSNADEQHSHGFVQYEIKPYDNLQLPVEINNRASIFFDSNPAILTNNVWNTLVSDLYVSTANIEDIDESIIVFPNPFRDAARLILSKSFINIESTFILLDAMGRMIEKRIVNGSEITITKGKLEAGIYFFELRNENHKRAFGKIVIEE